MKRLNPATSWHMMRICSFLSILVLLLLPSLIPRAFINDGNSAYGNPETVASLTEPRVWSRNVEIRAVWMDYRGIPSTEAEIRSLVRSLVSAGFNVLHPEAIYNGYSSYPSRYLSQDARWGGLDVLGIVISEGHKLGAEVHPWMRVFRVGHTGDRGGILKAHPNWVAVDRQGQELSQGGGLWLCPSREPVRKLLLRLVEEIATKYEIDGLHLDYIRYDSQEFCYCQTCRAKFKAGYGLDPLDIQPFTKPAIDWHLWREQQINSFVKNVSELLRQVRPEAKLSAAVAPSPNQARLEYLQNWENWVANQWLDYVEPMNYTADNDYFRSLVIQADAAIADRALLVPGISIMPPQTIGTVLSQVQIAREQPTLGISLFSTSHIDEASLKELRRTVFNTKASVPLGSPTAGARKLVKSAHDALKKDHSADELAVISSDLEAARRLLAYQSSRMQPAEFVPPSKPPITIPEHIIPLPELIVPFVDNVALNIDGRLDEPSWQKASTIALDYTKDGGEAWRKTTVYILSDKERLYLAYICEEPAIKSLKSQIKQNDGPVFLDDSVELFLSPTADAKSYYHLALNALGVKYDALGKSAKENLQWVAATNIGEDRWTAELMVPLSSLGVGEENTHTSRWRVNLCRNRVLDFPTSEVQHFCWSPTYGSYHTPARFGFVQFQRSVQRDPM